MRHDDSVLRLLQEEAPDSAFDSLEGTLTPADLAAARDIREVLKRRHRRETELAALYETAGDLSSLRDLEAVLQAIVRRARELLGTDAAYLTLIDADRGDTHMRVTDGIVTDRFKQVRLAMGAGLGGLVAETATPYATADYSNDERFEHVIDDIVGDEHLVGILGVPLKLGRRVIGVLFAADRRPRPFAPEEVALLSSLAAHAAIAMENARLFSEAQETLRNLSRANTIIRTHSEAVEKAAQMHERLTSLLLQGGGMSDVAATVADVLGADLLVLDAAGRVATAAPEGRASPGTTAGDACGPGLEEALARCQATGRTVRVPAGDAGGADGTDPDAGAGWVTPVAAGAQHLGALVLLRPELAEADLRMLERAAQVTALLLLNERSLAEAEQRIRGDLLDDLLVPFQRDVDGLRRRARLLGADLDNPHVVAVARPVGTDGRRAVVNEASRLAAEAGGLAGEHGGRVVLLLPGEDESPGETAQRVLLRLRAAADGPVTVGGAGPAAGPAALAASYADAVRCHEVLTALGREGQAAGPQELGIYGLLFSQIGRAELQSFVRRTLGPVLDYDAAKGTDLAGTLLAYFRLDGNANRTAAELFVHINTLYQRLDRVTQLLGPDWRAGDAAQHLHLALRVHQVGAPD